MTLSTALETALNRIEDMLSDDDGQAFKEARKFLPVGRAALVAQPGSVGDVAELLSWFEEAGGFAQGTKAPHKWVLQAEQELRRFAAAPTEAVRMSDQEIDELWKAPMSADWEHREFARAVEQATAARLGVKMGDV